MKAKHTAWFRRYRTELNNHLKDGSHASLQQARELGRRAVVIGLETLDVARIHEGTVAAIEISGRRAKIIKQAELFFSEVIAPIEMTHRAAREASAHMKQLNEKLGQRTKELADSNVQLQRGIVRRKDAEAALKKSGLNNRKCLEESLQLQKRLRQLTQRVLAAQEDERHKISHELQDEIAQTLLGINVRLLSLKQEARSHSSGLKNEIASTQRLVVKSAKSVRHVARKFGNL